MLSLTRGSTTRGPRRRGVLRLALAVAAVVGLALPSSAQAHLQNLVAVTWNMQGGTSGGDSKWTYGVGSLLQFADVVALQESGGPPGRAEELPDQLARSARGLVYPIKHYTWWTSWRDPVQVHIYLFEDSATRTNLALVTKTPASQLFVLDPLERRPLLGAKIGDRCGHTTFFTIHAGAHPNNEAPEMVDLVRGWMAANREWSWAVLGDFNLDARWFPLPRNGGRQPYVVYAPPVATHAGGSIYDYMVSSQTVEGYSAEAQQGRWSDHLPVKFSLTAWLARAPLPATCADLHAQSPESPDGEYELAIGGRTLRVYCHDMSGAPREYLSLPHSFATQENVNYSFYGPGPNTAPDGVTTWYTKLRFLPDALAVDVTDRTFAWSDGGWMSFGPSFFHDVDFASAGDCRSGGSQGGTSSIDLLDLPLRVVPGQFVVEGWEAAGGDSYAWDSQVVDLRGGGYCGSNATTAGRLELTWVEPVFLGYAQVALAVPELGAGLVARDGVVDSGAPDTYWDLVPVAPDDPYQGYHLAMNGQYISTTTRYVEQRNQALTLVDDVAAAAAFVPVPTLDGTSFSLRLVGSRDVLTFDTRGMLGQLEPLQSANGFPYFQYFTASDALRGAGVCPAP